MFLLLDYSLKLYIRL